MNNDDLEIIRSNNVSKSEPFAFCRWAAGEWEAKFYAHTPAHVESREATIHLMRNDVAWFKNKKKIDAKQAIKNNKARGTKK